MKLPLPGQYAVIIKICGLLLKMPLANHCRLITGLLHFAGQMLAPSLNSSTQIMDTTGMRILTGNNRRPARGTNCVGTKGILKKNPFLGQSINGGSRVQLGKPAPISPNSLGSMVIGHNKNYVWSLRRLTNLER